MITHNTADRPGFVRQQYAIAAHIRDPDRNPCPEGIEERRMKIYRELFYNNVESFIASTYPVLRKIMPDDQWHAMIRNYFANHISHTPLFPEMPREFLKYLKHEREPQPDEPPFLLELVHYEWVELALSLLDERIDATKIDVHGDFLVGFPVISPLAWPLSYRFPVHKIGPSFQPKEADGKQTHLIVYRDAGFDVHFIEINPVTARLLQLLSGDDRISGQTALQQIAVELNHPQPDRVIQGGIGILNDLKRRQVILGVHA